MIIEPDSIDPLTPEESELAGDFYNVAADHPGDSFLDVATRVLGLDGFIPEHRAVFRVACRRHFDLAHKDMSAESES
jgi:hypothetical protein